MSAGAVEAAVVAVSVAAGCPHADNANTAAAARSMLGFIFVPPLPAVSRLTSFKVKRQQPYRPVFSAMIEKRSFDSLGKFDADWLAARYHFSFSGYHDPKRVNWGALRVWNDDTIQPKTGFPPHPHSDMEIITYVRTGAITHQDSMGNKGRTEAGDVQVMSAGSGVTHAEYNLEDDATTLYQIWILPKARGGKPFWGAAKFPKSDRAGALVTLASGFDDDQKSGALPIRQDARVLAATLEKGQSVSYPLGADRFAYVAVAKGEAKVNGVSLGARDGAAIRDETELRIEASDDARAR
jgi:redox-sensitive bicupin YhaK (pirin superfamily)